ncbi:unnamed protein product [Peniophora sp. CBMAI 1063]|nr:unnamed protein product [Peniophora sp. CBMAI 1063]
MYRATLFSQLTRLQRDDSVPASASCSCHRCDPPQDSLGHSSTLPETSHSATDDVSEQVEDEDEDEDEEDMALYASLSERFMKQRREEREKAIADGWDPDSTQYQLFRLQKMWGIVGAPVLNSLGLTERERDSGLEWMREFGSLDFDNDVDDSSKLEWYENIEAVGILPEEDWSDNDSMPSLGDLDEDLVRRRRCAPARRKRHQRRGQTPEFVRRMTVLRWDRS